MWDLTWWLYRPITGQLYLTSRVTQTSFPDLYSRDVGYDQGQIEYRSRIENWRISWVTSPGDSSPLLQGSYIWPAELRKLHSQTCILEMLIMTSSPCTRILTRIHVDALGTDQTRKLYLHISAWTILTTRYCNCCTLRQYKICFNIGRSLFLCSIDVPAARTAMARMNTRIRLSIPRLHWLMCSHTISRS